MHQISIVQKRLSSVIHAKRLNTLNRPSAKVSLSNNISKTIKQTRLRSNIVYNKGLDNVVELRIS